MEDYSIYADLDNIDSGPDIQEIKSENERLQLSVDELKSLNDELSKELNEYKSKYKQLTTNLSSLLLTAQAEIKRKDVTIGRLQQEKDDIVLRQLCATKPRNVGRGNSNNPPKEAESYTNKRKLTDLTEDGCKKPKFLDPDNDVKPIDNKSNISSNLKYIQQTAVTQNLSINIQTVVESKTDVQSISDVISDGKKHIPHINVEDIKPDQNMKTISKEEYRKLKQISMDVNENSKLSYHSRRSSSREYSSKNTHEVNHERSDDCNSERQKWKLKPISMDMNEKSKMFDKSRRSTSRDYSRKNTYELKRERSDDCNLERQRWRRSPSPNTRHEYRSSSKCSNDKYYDSDYSRSRSSRHRRDRDYEMKNDSQIEYRDQSSMKSEFVNDSRESYERFYESSQKNRYDRRDRDTIPDLLKERRKLLQLYAESEYKIALSHKGRSESIEKYHFLRSSSHRSDRKYLNENEHSNYRNSNRKPNDRKYYNAKKNGFRNDRSRSKSVERNREYCTETFSRNSKIHTSERLKLSSSVEREFAKDHSNLQGMPSRREIEHKVTTSRLIKEQLSSEHKYFNTLATSSDSLSCNDLNVNSDGDTTMILSRDSTPSENVTLQNQRLHIVDNVSKKSDNLLLGSDKYCNLNKLNVTDTKRKTSSNSGNLAGNVAQPNCVDNESRCKDVKKTNMCKIPAVENSIRKMENPVMSESSTLKSVDDHPQLSSNLQNNDTLNNSEGKKYTELVPKTIPCNDIKDCNENIKTPNSLSKTIVNKSTHANQKTNPVPDDSKVDRIVQTDAKKNTDNILVKDGPDKLTNVKVIDPSINQSVCTKTYKVHRIIPYEIPIELEGQNIVNTSNSKVCRGVLTGLGEKKSSENMAHATINNQASKQIVNNCKNTNNKINEKFTHEIPTLLEKNNIFVDSSGTKEVIENVTKFNESKNFKLSGNDGHSLAKVLGSAKESKSVTVDCKKRQKKTKTMVDEIKPRETSKVDEENNKVVSLPNLFVKKCLEVPVLRNDCNKINECSNANKSVPIVETKVTMDSSTSTASSTSQAPVNDEPYVVRMDIRRRRKRTVIKHVL